jgi:hypothetical protein
MCLSSLLLSRIDNISSHLIRPFCWATAFYSTVGIPIDGRIFTSDLAGDSHYGVLDTTLAGSADLRYRLSFGAAITVESMGHNDLPARECVMFLMPTRRVGCNIGFRPASLNSYVL